MSARMNSDCQTVDSLQNLETLQSLNLSSVFAINFINFDTAYLQISVNN